MILNNLDDISTLSFALDNVAAYIYIKDKDYKYLYANALTLELFNCTEQELIGKDDHAFFPKEAIKTIRKIDEKVLSGIETVEEVEVIEPSGKRIVYLEKKKPIYDDKDSSNIVGILGISTDITERKILEEKLYESAMTDFLTNIANRRAIMNELDRTFKRVKRSKQFAAVLFIDLNDFKDLNDNFGHDVGDKVLIELANRLTLNTRESDTVGRMGGDEFVLLIENLGLNKDEAITAIEAIINKLTDALKPEFFYKEHAYEIRASIGYTIFNEEACCVDEILTQADSHMYAIKREKK